MHKKLFDLESYPSPLQINVNNYVDNTTLLADM